MDTLYAAAVRGKDGAVRGHEQVREAICRCGCRGAGAMCRCGGHVVQGLRIAQPLCRHRVKC